MTEFWLGLRYILRKNKGEDLIHLVSEWPFLSDSEKFERAQALAGSHYYSIVYDFIRLCYTPEERVGWKDNDMV